MFKFNNQVINIQSSYGVSNEGLFYPGRLPDGVQGVNHAPNTGPITTEDGRTALGIVEEVTAPTFDSRFYFAAGVKRPIEDVASVIMTMVNGHCDTLLATIKASYPQSEIDTWYKQEQEAKAFTSDNQAVTPLLDSLCDRRRGLDKAELVTRILNKAQMFAVASGLIVGSRQDYEDQVQEIVLEFNSEETTESQKDILFQQLIDLDINSNWPSL